MLRILPLLVLLLLGACAVPLVSPDADLETYYALAQKELLAGGRLRTDTDPPDAPFTADDLVRDFIRVALFDEYSITHGRYVLRQNASRIRRWERPVRIDLIFGESTPPDQRRTDLAEVRSYTRKLARLSGVDMRFAAQDEHANYLVLFLNRAEQFAFGDQLRLRFPSIEPAVIDAFRNSPRNTFCVAYSFSKPSDPYAFAVSLILIKAEHKGIMRRSCIHEEMAQAMGLANDSLQVRPSIFNDDEEFALLTRHDEILLRMLYDPRLKPGMNRARAEPLLHDIAQDALAAGAGS